MQSKWIKGVSVVAGSVLLSTLGIFAADSLQGIGGGVGQFAGIKNAGVCVEGMVPLSVDGKTLCADMYEVSPSEKCPHREPSNVVQTEENANTSECYAASVKAKSPWNFISLSQAQRVCAQTGKRLPTSEEWYHIALGTNPDACTIHETSVLQSGNESCVSSIGAYDAVGNVWEWVDEQVTGNSFEGRTLPDEGYVTSVDAQGVAISSAESADDLYGKDYIWSKNEGVFGMIRGGFYGSDQDAGLYTVNASVQTNFASQGVGFRCVKDVF